MTDLGGAVALAVYERLRDGVTLCPVFQHVPENTDPPYVILLPPAGSQIGGKGSDVERFEVEVAAATRNPALHPLGAIMGEVKEVLNHFRPTQNGSVSEPPGVLVDLVPQGAFSPDLFAGDFSLKFRITATGNGIDEYQIGMDANPRIANAFEINYGIFFVGLTSVPRWRIYKDSTLIVDLTAYPLGDFEYEIVRTGLSLAFKINGAAVYTFTLTSVVPLGPVFALFHLSQVFRDIRATSAGVPVTLPLIPWGGAKATSVFDAVISEISHLGPGTAPGVLEDGITYYGSQRFLAIAQPAD